MPFETAFNYTIIGMILVSIVIYHNYSKYRLTTKRVIASILLFFGIVFIVQSILDFLFFRAEFYSRIYPEPGIIDFGFYIALSVMTGFIILGYFLMTRKRIKKM